MNEINEKLLEEACNSPDVSPFELLSEERRLAKAVARKYLELIGNELLADAQEASFDPLTQKERVEMAREFLEGTGCSVGQWISVEDKLPKPGQKVICFFNDGKSTHTDICLPVNHIGIKYKAITHWMPLFKEPTNADAS